MTYTVVGFYESTKQRFCQPVDAVDADEAEREVLVEFSKDGDLFVCGVFEGDHEPKESEGHIANLLGPALGYA